MGLSNNTGQAMTYVKCDATKALFQKQEKVNGIWESTDTYNNLDGTIKEVRLDSYEYKNELKKKLVIILSDGPELFKVDINLNGVAKSIINTLASELEFMGSQLSLSLYMKGEYCRVAILIDDRRGDWRIKGDDLKAMDSDIKWVKLFDKFIKPQNDEFQEKNAHTQSAEPVAASSETEDDLPF